MSRSILDEAHIHPAIRGLVSNNHRDLVAEVQAAVAAHAVVVVGMTLNHNVPIARKLLDGLGTPYKYLGYGGYFSMWRARNALKMWTGWPTFPMIFVKGVLIGGATDLQQLVKSGEFATMVA
jgi:glutaredoxin-related protein